MPLVFADLMESFTTDTVDAALGIAVAVSADGKIAVISAPGPGIVYTSTRTNGVFGPLQILTSGNSGSFFGFAVAASSDGSVILIGIPHGFQPGGFISVINGVPSQIFMASDSPPFGGIANFFGASIAISYDGKTAVIGAPGFPFGQKESAAYIFVRSDVVWTQQGSRLSNNTTDEFGTSVDMSADGNTVIIGAPGTLSGQGSASVFKRSDTAWIQTFLIIASDGIQQDLFGTSVGISADVSTIIIGAPQATVNNNSRQGKAYVFTNFDDTWPLQITTPLTTISDSPSAKFGQSVALSCDGDIALVGAPGYPTSTQNVAFFFTRCGVAWNSSSTAISLPNTFAFGRSVALSADGMITVVGDPDYPNGQQEGLAAVYRCGYCFCCGGSTQGPTGPQGPAGIQGQRGSDGATGTQGIQGLQGPAGSDGAKGDMGLQGIQGPQGTTGLRGPAGANLTAHAYLGQIILFSLMLYGGFLLIFSVITFF